MTQPFQIIHGLPKGYEQAAAKLYWEAFGAKLRILMGPATRAEGFFAATLHHNSIIAAVSPENKLLGIAAVKLNGIGFSDANLTTLFRHYGIGTLWKIIPLAMLERTPPKDTLQMDGICVSSAARGMGVGTALLDAVFETARQNNLPKVTLDVIDTNPRAKSLYERRGFVATSEESTSILQPLLGFKSATKMVKDVTP